MVLTESDLLDAGDDGLAELFGRSPAGDIPKGPLEGTGIVRWGGGWLARPLAWLVRVAVWRGKVFDSEGYLSNRMTSFDVLAVLAQVYKGPSLMDEQECIVIDYSRISLAARGYATRCARSARACISVWSGCSGSGSAGSHSGCRRSTAHFLGPEKP